jgi:putative oxidoreductase
MGRLRRLALWACVVVLAVVFVLVGTSKLTGPSSVRWSERFARWGFPPHVHSVVGVLEVLGGVGLLIPMSRRAAAAALLALMVGALVTHLVHGEPARIAAPLILGGMALLVCSWGARRPST